MYNIVEECEINGSKNKGQYYCYCFTSQLKVYFLVDASGLSISTLVAPANLWEAQVPIQISEIGL